MSKIARITADKKLLLSNEIIEGDKISLNADGTLYVNEIIENDKFSINSNGIEVTKLMEGASFAFGEILEGKIKLEGVTDVPGAISSDVTDIYVDLFPLYYDGWHEFYDNAISENSRMPSLSIQYDTETSSYVSHKFIYYNSYGLQENRLFEYNNSYKNYRIVIGNALTNKIVGVKGEFILRRGSETGEILYKQYYDCHVGKEGGCYLTTAMVGYFNKADDGIELTAMRELRSHSGYKYQDVLEEYSQASSMIIRGIEQSGNKDYYYNMIKDVVNNIVLWVANEEWERAETAYLELYYYLKEKFGVV